MNSQQIRKYEAMEFDKGQVEAIRQGWIAETGICMQDKRNRNNRDRRK